MFFGLSFCSLTRFAAALTPCPNLWRKRTTTTTSAKPFNIAKTCQIRIISKSRPKHARTSGRSKPFYRTRQGLQSGRNGLVEIPWAKTSMQDASSDQHQIHVFCKNQLSRLPLQRLDLSHFIRLEIYRCFLRRRCTGALEFQSQYCNYFVRSSSLVLSRDRAQLILQTVPPDCRSFADAQAQATIPCSATQQS